MLNAVFKSKIRILRAQNDILYHFESFLKGEKFWDEGFQRVSTVNTANAPNIYGRNWNIFTFAFILKV